MQLQNVILLMGPPGTGKGTQSKLLVEKLGYGYFSMGDTFRELAKQDSELARQVKAIIDKGHIVTDDLTIQVFESSIEKMMDKPGLIIDGFPRTLGQLEMLNELLQKHSVQNFKVFFLDVDKEKLLHRLSLRSQSQGRVDDADVAAVEKRFDEYMTKTAPVKEYYESIGKLIHINGDQAEQMDESIQKVHESIMEHLK